MSEIEEAGKRFIDAVFAYRCAQFTITQQEDRRVKKSMQAYARSLAEHTEDDELRDFIEQMPDFKPTPYTLQLRQSQQVMQDPEMVKQLHDLHHKMDDAHHD